MRILADENVDVPIIAWLAARGHNVRSIYDSSFGASDEAVVTLAEREERVLITSDRDFGELVFRRGARPAGVIYLRLSGLTPEELLAKFQAAWTVIESRAPESFVVVTPGPIRVRPLGGAES